MNHTEFLDKLRNDGFEIIGKSYAFKEINDWLIAFIGLGGRFQQAGTKAFVICARPKYFGLMDVPNNKYPSEPMEYPYKLTLGTFQKNLTYKSQLLNFDYDRLEIDTDWSNVYKILSFELPQVLKKKGVVGLVNELKELKEPGYVERIWLGEANA